MFGTKEKTIKIGVLIQRILFAKCKILKNTYKENFEKFCIIVLFSQ